MLKLHDRFSVELRLHRCTMRSGGTAHEGERCDRSIGSAVSDAIARSWLSMDNGWSVAGCIRLQLGVPHWDTSVDYCKYFIIDPTFCGSIFSTGSLLAIGDSTFYLINFPRWWSLLVGHGADSAASKPL